MVVEGIQESVGVEEVKEKFELWLVRRKQVWMMVMK